MLALTHLKVRYHRIIDLYHGQSPSAILYGQPTEHTKPANRAFRHIVTFLNDIAEVIGSSMLSTVFTR